MRDDRRHQKINLGWMLNATVMAVVSMMTAGKMIHVGRFWIL